MKITKKEVKSWLDETVSEDWKAYKRILKNERGYKTKQEFLDDSYDFGCNDEYDSLNWSAGYISALKRVLELLNNK
jgi:hypothetical protein